MGSREVVRCVRCAVASLCVVSCARCVVAAVALLGSGSLGSAVGGDGAVGAVVPRWPALMGERVASDSAGSTTSDLSRPSGERAGGIAMWRARPQWTKSQAINGKETNAPKVQRPKVECSYGLRSYSPKVLRVYEIKAPAHFLLTPWLQKC